MTHNQANVIYKNVKQGKLTVDARIINRIYLEADSCMYYANLSKTDTQKDNDKRLETAIMDAVFNNQFNKAQELINERYGWVVEYAEEQKAKAERKALKKQMAAQLAI